MPITFNRRYMSLVLGKRSLCQSKLRLSQVLLTGHERYVNTEIEFGRSKGLVVNSAGGTTAAEVRLYTKYRVIGCSGTIPEDAENIVTISLHKNSRSFFSKSCRHDARRLT
jgi:hypothetical protein